LELELTRIDLEWERERQKYMQQAGVLGGIRVPRKNGAVLCGLFTPAVGIVLGIVVVALGGEPAIVAGIAAAGSALLLGLVVGLILYSKAERYQQAEAEYRRKREAAKSKFGGAVSRCSDERNNDHD
jgi:hypothetical protein